MHAGAAIDRRYRSWCHSPVATFSLCLLSQVYDHACDLLQEFADMEVSRPSACPSFLC